MKKASPGVLSPVSRPKGGILVNHHKNTQDCRAIRMTPPSKVILPMQQHIGAPCTPTVEIGDTVDVGQVIGNSDKFVSSPIHASVSGKVVAIGPVTLATGKNVQSVTIESDGEMRLSPDIKPPVINNREDFLKAVRASGLVGLGGAGFPSHVKLTIPPDKNVDTLVVNAAECEPYITVDYRECIDNTEHLLTGIAYIRKYLNISNVVIAIEDNKPKAIEILTEKTENDREHIKVMALKSHYPQGAEKMMVYSATGRKVAPGKLPADAGCIVMNVGSVAFVGKYMTFGKPLVSRTMTVDGSAIKEPRNVRVPIGTNIGDIINFCGGFSDTPYKMIAGGPMMGLAMIDSDAPVLKSYNAVLAFTKGTFKVKRERDCIRCGRCASVCPMRLIPTDIERYAKVRDAEKLRLSNVDACMQCGSCAYVCPAGKPLVQHMILGKEIVKEAGDEK